MGDEDRIDEMTNHPRPVPPPSWLKPEKSGNPGETFHYGRPDNGNGLVIYPRTTITHAILDGEFTASDLREIADWIEQSMKHHDI